MLKKLKNHFITRFLSEEERSRVLSVLKFKNSAGYDPWGVDPDTLLTSVASTLWIYKHYFRTQTFGIENIPKGRCLLVANHSGQIPIDGMMITIATLLKANPPRLARGMVERWAPTLPFVSTFFSRNGQITGDQNNCRDLLEHEECVMVFPEGAPGLGKTIHQKYQLQRFGSGFARLALETSSPIVPVAVIGCEEAYPSINNLQPIARKLGIPYIPIIPTGPLPLPTQVTIRFGEPIQLTGSPQQSDSELEAQISKVKSLIEHEIKEGLKYRNNLLFTGVGAPQT